MDMRSGIGSLMGTKGEIFGILLGGHFTTTHSQKLRIGALHILKHQDEEQL